MTDPRRPDVVILMTDEERATPPYESADLLAWRRRALGGRRSFDENGVSFARHYTGSLACVPSRPTIFTGQYPDLHGVTQTDGIGKRYDDSRLRWLRSGEVPTLGNWFRAAGYDTHYDGKWHISHTDLEDPVTGGPFGYELRGESAILSSPALSGLPFRWEIKMARPDKDAETKDEK